MRELENLRKELKNRVSEEKMETMLHDIEDNITK